MYANKRTLVTALAMLAAAPAAGALACPGNPQAAGTARVLTLDPAEQARVGTITNRRSLPLESREVVLTFEAGPLPPFTNRVLEALARECVRVNFFTVGQMAGNHPDLVRRIHAAGHVVGTHTQTHPDNLDRMPLADARREIDQGITSVAAALGSVGALAPFFRFPGSGRSAALEKELREREIAVWGADVSGDEGEHIGPAEVVRRVMSRLDKHGGGVVRLHDSQPAAALALPELLRRLREGGYRIVQVAPPGYISPHDGRPAAASAAASPLPTPDQTPESAGREAAAAQPLLAPLPPPFPEAFPLAEKPKMPGAEPLPDPVPAQAETTPAPLPPPLPPSLPVIVAEQHPPALADPPPMEAPPEADASRESGADRESLDSTEPSPPAEIAMTPSESADAQAKPLHEAQEDVRVTELPWPAAPEVEPEVQPDVPAGVQADVQMGIQMEVQAAVPAGRPADSQPAAAAEEATAEDKGKSKDEPEIAITAKKSTPAAGQVLIMVPGPAIAAPAGRKPHAAMPFVPSPMPSQTVTTSAKVVAPPG